MIGTLIVGLIVFGCAALALRKILRDRRRGSSCGCDCDGCSAGCASADKKSEAQPG